MDKDKKILNQGILVYVLANALGKASDYFKLIALTVLLLATLIYIVRSAKNKESVLYIFTLLIAVAFELDGLVGIIIRLSGRDMHAYENGAILIARAVLAIAFFILYFWFGLKRANKDTRKILIKYLIILGIIAGSAVIMIFSIDYIFP